MSRTMPRVGLAIGAVSIAMGVAGGLVWWAPFAGGAVGFTIPALFGALAAFVRGAWRLAAVAACLCVCVGIAFGISSRASPPGPVMTVLVVAPFAISLGLGAWLAIDFRRARTSIEVRELPSWLSTVRDLAGVFVGGFSVVAALCVLPAVSWPTFLGPFGVTSPWPGLMDVFRFGIYLFPLAFLGALTALACGAWRTAALAAFLCIPMFLRLDGLETYPFSGRTSMVGPVASVVAGAVLVVCLILSYRESRPRKVGRTMPRFGLVVGTVSLAMAIADGLVWSAPFAGGMTLVVPALFGALVAFVHGAWRLASVTACLCLCVAIAVVIGSSGSLPQFFMYILAAVPFAISLGLGSWLALDYRLAGASVVRRRLPEWLHAVRDRAGVVVGGISVLTVLGAEAPNWWMRFSLIMEPGTGVFLFAGPNFYLISICFLGALTALACGAWRTAVLGAFLCVPPLLAAAMAGPGYSDFGRMIGSLVAAATLTACLVWSYRWSASDEAVQRGSL